MSKESSLMKKTAIYAVGNMGSKVLSYIMVLVYSHYIMAEELGYYDLILTTVTMVYPLASFQISDGVYRFLLNSQDEDKCRILATAFRFVCMTTALAEMIFLILAVRFELEYAVWSMLYFAGTLFYFYFHDAIRGLGETAKYATVGIVNSIVMLLVEVIGLLVFDLGVVALLSANVISYGVCIGLMIARTPILRRFFKERFNKRIFYELIHYSAPLVPNTICWWVVNSSDRYLILAFLGQTYNGIYSMSNKFPTILTTITGIFYLAWQETAIKEYHSPNRDAFFSDIFRKYSVLLLTLCVCAIPMTHIVITLFVGEDYRTAWIYSGYLYLGAAFSALCSFLGLGYQISKETGRSLVSTIGAAGINIAVNVLLVGSIGLQAASLSTFLAYLCLFFIRIKHTKCYFTLSVNWKEFFTLLGMVLAIQWITVWQSNLILSVILSVVGTVFVLIKNKELLIPLVRKVSKK